MSTDFSYLLKKIEQTDFSTTPFKHLEIADFLAPEHFDAIVRTPQIKLDGYQTTEALLDGLEANGYVIIPFPGCVTNKKEYLTWFHGHSHKKVHEATESFGIVLRLAKYQTAILEDLNKFFESPELVSVLCRKFGIDGKLTVDAGLQKYLHGYEISPHPDIRRKALTWMLNINPGTNPEEAEFHTHYLQFKPEFRFITEFWKGNTGFDREWVPWGWCETAKRQRANNSIVFFSPSNDTMHAVKADYDHLKTQRTQFYGNLWYPNIPIKKISFKAFDIAANQERVEASLPLHKKVRANLKNTKLGDTYRAIKKTLTGENNEKIRKV